MWCCKRTGFDCIYADRDNDYNCSLNACKFNIQIKYKSDGTFETKPIKIKKKKIQKDK